jgi:hypothetical protein
MDNNDYQELAVGNLIKLTFRTPKYKGKNSLISRIKFGKQKGKIVLISKDFKGTSVVQPNETWEVKITKILPNIVVVEPEICVTTAEENMRYWESKSGIPTISPTKDDKAAKEYKDAVEEFDEMVEEEIGELQIKQSRGLGKPGKSIKPSKITKKPGK